MKVVKKVNPKSSHHKKNIFFLISLILYLHEMIDVHKTYCGLHNVRKSNDYAVHLDLYSIVCQLYLNKTGRKKKENTEDYA